MSQVVCIGQALVDCITGSPEPTKPNVFRAERITLSCGGDALNEASVLAKDGISVSLVCGVGDDPAGDLVLKTAEKRGVDVSRASLIPGMVTPIANLIVEKDGSRISYNSPATKLKGYLPDPSVVKGAKVVSLASLFRAPFDKAEEIVALIRAAKAEGAIVVADTKLPTYREISILDIDGVLPLIDYIFPNENEAAWLTEGSIKGKITSEELLSMARRLKPTGIRHVVVKGGAAGIAAVSDTEAFTLPALPGRVVDSTGAGDSFAAGFIEGLLDNADFRTCCERGLQKAAECVAHAGAFEE